MDFDLDAVDTKTLSESGMQVQIRRLDGSALIARNGGNVKILVAGQDSDRYRKLVRSQIRRRLRDREQTNGKHYEDDVDVEAEVAELLAHVTLGWENVLDLQQQPIPFTVDNARALYSAYPVVREQVDAFIANRANFLKASSEN